MFSLFTERPSGRFFTAGEACFHNNSSGKAGFRSPGGGVVCKASARWGFNEKFPCGLRRRWFLSSALRAEISSPAGEICSRLCRVISSLCERVNFFSSGKEISPGFFRIRGFIYPGSYLLSRDLSSDYHRRADVSLPGSEWVRVGPSGYDHQASVLTSFAGSSLLRNS